MSTAELSAAQKEMVYGIADRILAETGKVICGKRREIFLLLAALIAGGHVLIEDVPGVGKTTLAAALSRAAGLDFKRAQFTPDVMASDITGFNMYNRKSESFEFREGLVNTNILLADEINRAAPKTQSSLLEAMEEARVTVDGVTYPLPDPFMVIATQNPAGYVGTYPLPEAQLDRFSLRISMGYPSRAEEAAVLHRRSGGDPMLSLSPAADRDGIRLLRACAERITLSDALEKYIVELVAATREREEFSLGASPRASLALMRLSKASALLRHREYVIPEDVAELYRVVTAHRVTLTRDAAARRVTAEQVLADILAATPVPFAPAGTRRSGGAV